MQVDGVCLRSRPAALSLGITLLLLLAAGPGGAATTSYQAETAAISGGAIESNWSGFTGTGFVNYNNEVGTYVEWLVNVPQAGPYGLAVRFANGTTVSRPMDILVNGASRGTLAGAPTGAWTSWSTGSLNVALAAGTNTVRAVATTAGGGPNVDRLDVNDPLVPGTDWSRLVVDSNLQRFPDPRTFGSWAGYTNALFLYGQYQTYKRTRDPRYLEYIRTWVDRHVDANGNIDTALNGLDPMYAGNLALILEQETGLARYKLAADRIRTRFDTYPRTTDGAFWHFTSFVGQNWLDGTFMSMPFLIRYGRQFGDATYANNEAAKQLVLYANHLRHPTNGLLYHGYDEQRDTGWSNPTTGRSAEVWCRAVGWYGVATIDVLEILPANHPQRGAILGTLQRLVQALANTQDPATGLWWQVMDKGTVSGNWLETSCSCMHTYTTHMAVKRGYVAASFQAVANKGRAGVMTKLSRGTDGLSSLRDICPGTGVGGLSWYLGRPRNTNDRHGLGAFLLMNEAMAAP